MTYIVMIIGFVFLVKGADRFVSGSSAIAGYFSVPPLIIGLTIVACGTGLPEAAISITAALRGANGIVIGNVLGSNMFNIMAALGVVAIIKPCPVTKKTLQLEYPLSVLTTGLLLPFCLPVGSWIMGNGREVNVDTATISRIEGAVLALIFGVFLSVMVSRVVGNQTDGSRHGGNKASAKPVKSAKADIKGQEKRAEVNEAKPEGTETSRAGTNEAKSNEVTASRPATSEASLIKSVVWVLLGIVGILLGGDLVVDSATAVARSFGISEALIGLTIVALGTSLPELVTGMVAAIKGETDIAIGNVIGSNIFNLSVVLGFSAMVNPIAVPQETISNLLILIGVSIIIFMPMHKKMQLTRGWGAALIIGYGLYLTLLIVAGLR